MSGHELARAAWSTAMPIDGGEHVIRASAPGREPYETKVTIAKARPSRRPSRSRCWRPRSSWCRNKRSRCGRPHRRRSRPVCARSVWPRPALRRCGGAGGRGGSCSGRRLSAKSDSNGHCTAATSATPRASRSGARRSREEILATIFAVPRAVALVACRRVALLLGTSERAAGVAHESGSTVGLLLGASPTGGVAGLKGSF